MVGVIFFQLIFCNWKKLKKKLLSDFFFRNCLYQNNWKNSFLVRSFKIMNQKIVFVEFWGLITAILGKFCANLCSL